MTPLEEERLRRIYYQDIVYSVCNSLDRIFGNRPTRGEGIVCGTLEKPTKQVQEAMKVVEQRCRNWAEMKRDAQIPEETKGAKK